MPKQPPKNRQFGQPEGNKPSPKPKGALNRTTIWRLAMKEVAQALRLGKEPDKVKVEIVKTGIREGLKGNYQFWFKIMQEFGLITKEELTELESGEAAIEIVIRKGDPTQGKN